MNIKSFLNHLKQKCFIYIVVTAILGVAWFGVLWEFAKKTPKDQMLYIWHSTIKEVDYTGDLEEGEINYNQVTNLLNFFRNDYGTYGYKKSKITIKDVDKDNNSSISTFTLYSDIRVDFFVMPIWCYTDDEYDFDTKNFTNDYMAKKSNATFCDRFITLEELFPEGNKEYDYLLEDLKDEGRIISFTKVKYYEGKEQLPPRNVGILINEDYVLSISQYHTTQSDTLLIMLQDICKKFNLI